MCLECVELLGSLISHSYSGTAVQRRPKHSPHGTRGYSDLLPVLSMFWPWVTESLCRCYFPCNTNTAAAQKNPSGSGSFKDKETVVDKAAADHHALKAALPFWPDLVSALCWSFVHFLVCGLSGLHNLVKHTLS